LIIKLEGDFKESNLDSYNKIADLILNLCGLDINAYKSSFTERRMSIAMNLEGIKNIEDYYKYLKDNPEKINNLVKHLTINVSSFFRNEEVFNYIENYLATIEEKKCQRLRIWSIGCSKGQEAYSIAMIVENLNINASGIQVSIDASDINDEVLKEAKLGIYNKKEIENVPERYRKYFHYLDDNRFAIDDKIKKYVKYRRENLLNLKIYNNYYNIVLCRNLLIFMKPIYHEMIYEILNKAMVKDGLLILGLTENLHPKFKESWEILSRKLKIYRKK